MQAFIEIQYGEEINSESRRTHIVLSSDLALWNLMNSCNITYTPKV